MKDVAIGSFEAAALMGVHFTRPKRMFDDGLLAGRALEPVYVRATPSTRTFVIYSSASCERNFRDYDSLGTAVRPRVWTHMRAGAIKRLKAEKNHIAFDDAVGTAEAARILRVNPTLVQRLVASGRVVGRAAWNPRRGGGRLWIVSRKSCEQNRQEVAVAESKGTKRGVKRGAKKSS